MNKTCIHPLLTSSLSVLWQLLFSVIVLLAAAASTAVLSRILCIGMNIIRYCIKQPAAGNSIEVVITSTIIPEPITLQDSASVSKPFKHW